MYSPGREMPTSPAVFSEAAPFEVSHFVPAATTRMAPRDVWLLLCISLLASGTRWTESPSLAGLCELRQGGALQTTEPNSEGNICSPIITASPQAPFHVLTLYSGAVLLKGWHEVQ